MAPRRRHHRRQTVHPHPGRRHHGRARPNREANAFADRNRQFLRTAINRPGHFVAITSQAPGIDTNPGIRWKETRTVITGPGRRTLKFRI